MTSITQKFVSFYNNENLYGHKFTQCLPKAYRFTTASLLNILGPPLSDEEMRKLAKETSSILERKLGVYSSDAKDRPSTATLEKAGWFECFRIKFTYTASDPYLKIQLQRALLREEKKDHSLSIQPLDSGEILVEGVQSVKWSSSPLLSTILVFHRVIGSGLMFLALTPAAIGLLMKAVHLTAQTVTSGVRQTLTYATSCLRS